MISAVACNHATRPEYGEEHNVISIAALQTLCDHTTSHTVTGNVTVRGRVTANDRFGEFVKKLVVEDASGGIEVALDAMRLADRFPFGAEVSILCNGLTLCNYGGKITIGYGTTEYGAGRIAESDIDRYIHLENPPSEAPAPLRLTIDQVTLRHVDCYVRIDGITFTERGNWCNRAPDTGETATTEHIVTDSTGRKFTIRVAPSVVYADEPLPEGRGSICGIVDYFAGRLSLRPTNYEVFF